MKKGTTRAFDPHNVILQGIAPEGVSRAGPGRLLTATGFVSEQVALWDIASGKKVAAFGCGRNVVCWYAAMSARESWRPDLET